jgi:hypothetical protein
MSKTVQKIIFILSIFLHINYYISAYFTHTLDIFFEHVTMGQDFFQIPNAAYSFLHGGALTGNLLSNTVAYTTCCGVNLNVYHPLFTLIVGYPLQLFSPWIAFGLWGAMHLLITALTVLFLWNRFSKHKYLYIALSLYLLNSYHYYEIQHAQYHFLLNFLTLLFLYVIINSRNQILGGILYFSTLLVKPIGLLWIIPLLIGKYFRTVVLGIFIYIVASVPFAMYSLGNYFFANLYSVVTTPIPSYNLLSLANLFPLNFFYVKLFSFCIAVGIITLQIFKKVNIFTTIFLWISFYLIFYSLVFHYHYSILAGLICLGILLNVFNPRKIEILPIVFITIPTPILFFHLFGDPEILPTEHLSIIALWSIFWLVILDLTIVYKIWKEDSKIAIHSLPYERIK